jgi:hypothetical protein
MRKIPSEERLSCDRLRIEGNRILKGPAVGPLEKKNMIE